MKKTSGTALITGGAKRLGASIATHLAKMGYNIIIHYNNSAKSAQNLQEKIIQNYQVDCQIIKADLSDSNQAYNLTKQISKDHKDWNLLVNNASIFEKNDFLNGGIKELKANFDIHLFAPALLTEGLALHCQKRKIPGNVINMIDKNIVRYQTKYFPYILSKKSLAEFTKMAALELAPNIRVNGIAPGFILNSIDEKNAYKQTKELISKIPLRKQGSENDIITAIEFLLKSEFVTGQILFIDGGANLNHAG
jgi:NAD(P)-dependent dehydrogenase (short-subunit alcohol dehydrogenase family)